MNFDAFLVVYRQCFDFTSERNLFVGTGERVEVLRWRVKHRGRDNPESKCRGPDFTMPKIRELKRGGASLKESEYAHLLFSLWPSSLKESRKYPSRPDMKYP